VAPTANPTNNNLIQFTSNQIITGISITDYESSTSYQTALEYSIADAMDGVSAQNVLDLVAASYSQPSAALRKSSVSITGVRALDTTSSISINYLVSVNTFTETYTTLSNQLVAATTGGTSAPFDGFLVTNGNIYGATVFAAGVCSTTPAATVLVTEPSDDDDDANVNSGGSADDDTLSAGAIAGIVIGVIAFIVIVGAIIFYVVGGGAFGSGGSSKQDVIPASTASSTYSKSAPAVSNNPVFGISAISNTKTSATAIDESNM